LAAGRVLEYDVAVVGVDPGFHQRVSLNSTCLRITGSYFISTIRSRVLILFFWVMSGNRFPRCSRV
jgi:hypothetical protein